MTSVTVEGWIDTKYKKPQSADVDIITIDVTDAESATEMERLPCPAGARVGDRVRVTVEVISEP